MFGNEPLFCLLVLGVAWTYVRPVAALLSRHVVFITRLRARFHLDEMLILFFFETVANLLHSIVPFLYYYYFSFPFLSLSDVVHYSCCC